MHRGCVKWVPISEDSELVDGGIDIRAEPGKRPNIGRPIYQLGWTSPQEMAQGRPLGWGMLMLEYKGALKTFRGRAKISEVGSSCLPKTGSSLFKQ